MKLLDRFSVIIVEKQMNVKLQDVRNNLVCEQCSMESTSAPQITVPSKPKTMRTTASLFSTPFTQFSTRDKPGTSRRVDVIQGTTSRRPSQHTTLIQKLHSVITSTQPSRSVSHPGTTIFSGSQTVAFPSPLPQASSSTANPNVVLEEHDSLIQFNNKVEKELDVEIAHTFVHGDVMRCECVKFSRDGKYLAAGCWDGKAHIYNVQAGTLNWWVFGMLLLGILTYLCRVASSEICLQKKIKSYLYVSAITETILPPVYGMEESS